MDEAVGHWLAQEEDGYAVADPEHGLKEEASVRERSLGCMMADLQQATAIQEGLAEQRLALEWGQTLFGRMLQVWTQLERHERLSYEDKVRLQVRMLDDATASLWHLHKAFVGTRRLLKHHQGDLQPHARGRSSPTRCVQRTAAPGKPQHLPRRPRHIS